MLNARPSIAPLLAVACSAALSLAGCATYVNIPAQPGDVASNNVNDGTVRLVMAAAVAHASNAQFAEQSDTVALPPGTSDATYDAVLGPSGDRVVRWNTQMANPASLEVAAVYVRGGIAQVDVIRPSSGGLPQLLSVHLEFGVLEGWFVTRDRIWHIPVERALRQANPENVAAPEPAADGRTRDTPERTGQDTDSTDSTGNGVGVTVE